MRKYYLIAIFIILVLLGIIIGARVISGEDDWICQNGEWIKHGNPDAPKPQISCEE
jgi:hypothetical protein